MRNALYRTWFLGLVLLVTGAPSGAAEPPNIILIVADDLGWGDVGCYGQQRFETPHLDQLAAEGLRFTAHYSGSTVCAPSRCALLTGRHTGHTAIRGNIEVQPIGQAPLPAAEVTIAEVLLGAGYRTGATGKWGLGYPGSEGEPNRQGFETWFGALCQRRAHRHYPAELFDNQQPIRLLLNENGGRRLHSQDLYTDVALRFIDEHAREPFFLYVPYAVPHADLDAPEDSVVAFDGRFEETAYRGGYRDTNRPRALFAAMVSRLDRDIGRIVASLERNGITDNTLILFTSDNGPHREGGADPVFFDSNGPFRGLKRDLYEGGIRVPLIVRWPAVIAPGSVTDIPSAAWDLLPTFAELAGATAPEAIDGVSIVPTFRGAAQPAHAPFYWEFNERGGSQAIRTGDWKGVRRGTKKSPDALIELYDLALDPGETTDVSSAHPEVVSEIARLMRELRRDVTPR